MIMPSPVDPNLKGFIGFRIVILFVFLMLALLLGLVYFRVIDVAYFNFVPNSVTANIPDGSQLVMEMNKSNESTQSNNFNFVEDIAVLRESLQTSTSIEGNVKSYDNDRITISSSDGNIYSLVPYSFDDYITTLSSPNPVQQNLLIIQVDNFDNPENVLYTNIYRDSASDLVGKMVKFIEYSVTSRSTGLTTKFVSVIYENK